MHGEDDIHCDLRSPCTWSQPGAVPSAAVLVQGCRYLPGFLLRLTQHRILMLGTKLLPFREGCGRVGRYDSGSPGPAPAGPNDSK